MQGFIDITLWLQIKLRVSDSMNEENSLTNISKVSLLQPLFKEIIGLLKDKIK